MIDWLNEFHFLRPLWLWAFVPLVILLWWFKHANKRHTWQGICEPQLLPYMVIAGLKKESRKLWLATLIGSLLIIALAGPTASRIAQPVYRQDSALVIALDLSLSMYANDVKPDRITIARYEIINLLKLRNEGQTALLAYAGEAFVITPLSHDINTMLSQLPALEPALMPAQGSRTDYALTTAANLLKQGGMSQGHILLVTDEIDLKRHADAINASKRQGYKVSILGIGTPSGAPIALPKGGFLKDTQANIIIPKFNSKVLQELAVMGGGIYHDQSIDDRDSEEFNQFFMQDLITEQQSEGNLNSDIWYELGPWLILFSLPLCALAFRKEGILWHI